MKDLRGKNAILTGASRGLGPYIADALAAEGVNLVLAARSADGLARTQSAVEAAHRVRAIVAPCDVSSRDELERLVDTAEPQPGPVDPLVNNPGVKGAGPPGRPTLLEVTPCLPPTPPPLL